MRFGEKVHEVLCTTCPTLQCDVAHAGSTAIQPQSIQGANHQILFSPLAMLFPPLEVTFFLSTLPAPGVLKNKLGP